MRHLTWAAAAIAVIAAAKADTDWVTVKLAGKPDVTIDVPAIVAHEYLPGKKAAKSDLMFIALTTQSNGDYSCMLSRHAYSKDFPRRAAEQSLNSAARDALCGALPGQSDNTLEKSEYLTSNGYAAGHCTASYIEHENKQPGQVIDLLAVAAPEGFYQLTCTGSDDSLEDARVMWGARWTGYAEHMRNSLHLPKKAK
jgi:hypothetical protein